MIQAIRSTASACGSALQYTDLRGRLRHLFGGHALRVAGARFLSRHGVDLYLIQLIGRWASSAILRYVPQAPLAVQHRMALSVSDHCSSSSSTTPSPLQDSKPAELQTLLAIQDEPSVSGHLISADPTPLEDFKHLQQLVESLQEEVRQTQTLSAQDADVFIQNPNTGYIHRPDDNESRSASVDWKSRGCRFRYGTTKHRRLRQLPDALLLCPGCFGFKQKREPQSKAT